MMSLLARSLAGFTLAAILALASWHARSLAPSGAWAAVFVGTLATAAGWTWCALLLAFFVSASLLSHWRQREKATRTRGLVEKGGERDAWQVLANGGVFALCALGALVAPSSWWAIAGAGALAGAASDTWATEVGTAIGGQPHHVLRWRPVPPGTSGAVTPAGSLAMLAGAAFVGTIALVGGFGRQEAVAVAMGGVAGALADTLVGATIQERRWCPRCREATERQVHDCGSATERRGGWARLNNDVVNLTSTLVGAAVAVGATG
jgi:uncharacterized protein (TIGR00297 family)